MSLFYQVLSGDLMFNIFQVQFVIAYGFFGSVTLMKMWSVKFSINIQWSGSRVLKEPGSLFSLMGSMHSLKSAVNHQ